MTVFRIVAKDERGWYQHWTGNGWHDHPAYGIQFLHRTKAEKVLLKIRDKAPNGGIPTILEHEGELDTTVLVGREPGS